MSYKVYILNSESNKKYYVGHNGMAIEERITRHLHDHGGYASNAKDWVYVYVEQLENKMEAFRKGREIKFSLYIILQTAKLYQFSFFQISHHPRILSRFLLIQTN